VSAFALIRKRIRWFWPEWTALSFYAALAAFAIPYHEPFADEAQAWQLARSNISAHSRASEMGILRVLKWMS
jgi:hypothetical protein